jgi:pyrroloquinoline quinone biosynthesis protein B
MGVHTVLQAFCGLTWHYLDGDFKPLNGSDGRQSSLQVRMFPLTGHAPRYAGKVSKDGVFTMALQILDTQTGGRMLIAPGLSAWSKTLQIAAEESNAVFVDGTFWSEDELQRVRPDAKTASEMGHLPIENGTLPILASLKSRYRVYVHINNTNPIFAADSKERKKVEAEGIIIGRDGMSFDL